MQVKSAIGIGSSNDDKRGEVAEKILAITLQKPSDVDANAVGNMEVWPT